MSSPATRPAGAAAPEHDYYWTAEDAARQHRIRTGWRAYNGDVAQLLSAPTRGPDLRVRVNLCKPIVRTSVAFLFGQPVTISVEDAGNVDGEKAQETLDAALGDTDDLHTLLSKFAMNGCISGHAFLKLVPADETGDGQPALIVLDPSTVSVQTSPDNCDEAMSYCIQYDTVDANGNAVTKRQIIERLDPDGDDTQQEQPEDGGTDTSWLITNYVRVGGPGKAFIPVGKPILWPHPWAPIHDNQHLPIPNEYWGEAAVGPDIIHLNEVINAVKSNTNLIIFHHAHPTPWADADVSGLTTEPGVWVGFPQNTKVGVVEAHGDIAQSMLFEKAMRGDISELGSIPGVAAGRPEDMPRGQLSGVALRLMYSPLLTLTTHGRRLYGRTLRRVCQHILELAGFPPNLKITLDWNDPLPIDDLVAAQTALAMEQAGASLATGLQYMGLDADVEASAKRDEQAQQLRDFTAGTGLPPTAMTDGGQQAASTEPGTPGSAAPASGLNPNHPAAVAQRNATAAVAAMMKPPASAK